MTAFEKLLGKKEQPAPVKKTSEIELTEKRKWLKVSFVLEGPITFLGGKEGGLHVHNFETGEVVEYPNIKMRPEEFTFHNVNGMDYIILKTTNGKRVLAVYDGKNFEVSTKNYYDAAVINGSTLEFNIGDNQYFKELGAKTNKRVEFTGELF